MRKLWDTAQNASAIVNDNVITNAELERQIIELRGIVTTFTNLVNATVEALEQYKDDNRVAFITETLTATNASVTALLTAAEANITELTSNIATISTLKSTIGTIETLYSDVASILGLSVDNLSVNTKAEVELLEADAATIDALTVNDLTITGLYNFLNIDATQAAIDTLSATNATFTNATIDDLTAIDATFTNAGITNASIVAETVTNAAIDKINVEQITHSLKHIEPLNEVQYIIAPPYFRNGQYRLIGINQNNEAVAAMDIRNDLSNIWLSWSRRPSIGLYIEECRIFDYNSQRPQIYIKVNEANNDKLVWYYEYQGFDTLLEAAPQTYNDYPFNISLPGSWLYKFIHNEGVYFSHAVDIISNEGEHDYASLILTPTDRWPETSWTAIEYNGLQDKDFKVYRPDQDLSTDADVTFHTISIAGLENKYVITLDGQFNSANPATVTNGILNPEFKPVEGSGLGTWNGKVAARDSNDIVYSNAMVFAGVVYSSNDGVCYTKVNITPDSLSHGTLTQFVDRCIIRKHDRTDYYISAAGVDVTPAGIESYHIYRYSISDLNAYVDYKVSDGVWEKLEEFIPATYVIDTNPFNVQPSYGQWTSTVYSYDDTNTTNPITKLGNVDEGNWDTLSTTESYVKSDIVESNNLKVNTKANISKHLFIGTSAQFTSAVANNEIADDCLVLIEG